MFVLHPSLPNEFWPIEQDASISCAFLFRFATALGSSPALDSTGFRTLNMVTWDPFLIVNFGAS